MANTLEKSLNALGSYTQLIISVILVILRRPPQWYLIRDQMYEIGVRSLPVVAITGFSTGMVLAAQSFFQLSDKGLAGATGLMVTKAMLVELGPVLTAFMVTGRVGASICAELGTMKVTEQIDALTSMSVNPLRYLVAPRFISGLIMLPLLTAFSCLMGIIGGFIVAVNYYGMSPAAFLDPLQSHIKTFDVLAASQKLLSLALSLLLFPVIEG